MSLELIVFISIVLIVLAIGYGFRKREIGAKAASMEIAYSAVIFGIVIIFFIAGYLVFSPKNRKNYAQAFLLLATVVMWVQFFSWLWRKSQAGPVLLDLGRSRQSRLSLIAGVLFIFAGILNLIESNLAGIPGFFLSLSLGLYFLFRGISRLAVRAHGFSCLERFIKWDRIISFSWEVKKDLTLTLRLKKQFLYSPIQIIAIPPHLKDRIEELLTTHLHDH